MPRPPIPRFVEHLPNATYFKPVGVPMRALQEVALTVDELEALRLKDLEGLEQEEAARQMGVARTTFRRVLVGARAKVASALVEGKAIRIAGGPFRTRWTCPYCGSHSGEPAAGASDSAGATPPAGKALPEESDAGVCSPDVGGRRGRRCRHCGRVVPIDPGYRPGQA